MRRFHLMVLALLTVFCFTTNSAWSASPRFVDLGEGALLDTATGLYWLKNAESFGIQSFDEAQSLCSNLSSGSHGLDDGSVAGQWRLPSFDELQSLAAAPDNLRRNDLTAAGFQNVGGSALQCYYWSSTQRTSSASYTFAKILEFDLALSSEVNLDFYETWKPHVWPVRDATVGYLTVSPATKEFVTVSPSNTSASQVFTISNLGTVDVAVSDISFTGGDSTMFTLDKGDGSGGTCGDTPTIAAQGSCTVTASFSQQGAGPKSTTLRVTSDAYNTPTTDTVLSGNTHEPNASWWKAENTVNDSVGSNNGISNAAFAPGKSGQAFSFDGSSAQTVAVPHSPSLDIYGSHTVMFWVKLDALPLSGQVLLLLNKFKDGAEDKRVTVDATGKVGYYLYGTTGEGAQSATALKTGEWTHVAATYDGSAQKIYINGRLDASAPAAGDVSDSNGILYMGFNPDRPMGGAMASFNGLLDEVAWDNRTLSLNQIITFAKIPPDPFSFTASIDMPRSMPIVSNAITVTGISSITDIAILGGEYAVSNDGGVNWSGWTDLAGTVNLNDQVRVRLTTSDYYDTSTTATLVIGGVSGLFTATTAKLGHPHANGLVSWWRAEDTVDDSVGINDGAKAVSVTVAENNTATAQCPTGATITSYNSVFGANSSWVDCGMCTTGDDSCSVEFSTALCSDPSPGVAKTGKLDIFYDTAFAPGQVGQAFNFDGSAAQWVSVPHSASLDIGTEHTVSFWIKLNALPTAGNAFYPVRKHTANLEHKQVSINADGRVFYFLHGTNSPGVMSAKAVPVGEWTHVTATYDGAAMKVYLNGVLDGSVPASGAVANSVGIVYIANSPDVFNDPFTGQIDEVKLFNETLSAGDVFQSVYGNGVPVDTDSDGIDDSWEQTNFGDLTTATATSDYDSDGYTDLQEYQNNKAIVADPDGVAFDPKRVNAPNGTGYVGGADMTPVLMLLLD